MVNAMDKTSDMDIYYDHATQTNMAFFAANVSGSFDKLYSMNLSTGATMEIGGIGMGIAVKDIAVQLAATPPATSVFEVNSNITDFTAYPNLMTGPLTLRFVVKNSSQVQISLFDVTGKKVADLLQQTVEAGENEVQFSTADLPQGLYILRMESNGQSRVIKLVK